MPRPRSLALASMVLVLAALPVRAQRDELEIVLGGDVIFDAPILYAIDRFYEDREEPALEELFSELAPALAHADLAIVNLECPIARRRLERTPEHDAPTFAAPASFADALARTGVDAVVLANNHAYDQGVEGLASTMAEVARAGMVAVGSGRDPGEASRAVVIERSGRRIAIAAFSEGSNRRVREGDPAAPRIALATEAGVAASVREARAAADLVIASLHWTSEIDHGRPTRSMARLARAAADAGADLVYAHGTHVPGPRGSLRAADGREVPVLWSLGNLVAVMEEPGERVHEAAPSVRDALLARVRVRRVGARLAVASIDPEPYWIAAPERAWTHGASPMVRPLSLRSELARIAEASCGSRCERYARSYRERERMLARLLGAQVEGPAESEPESEPELLVPTGSEAPTGSEVPAESEPAAESEAGAETRRARSAPARPIDGPLGRGVALRVAFPPGGAIESSYDDAQIAQLVALLRADGALSLEIGSRPARGEPRGIASARAHRARGLIAIRGPSRSRIALRTLEPTGDPELVVRVLRVTRDAITRAGPAR